VDRVLCHRARGPLAKGDIEYKGLTATGFETPWLAGGTSCGTRGMGIPLIAFSVRIKPSRSAQYDSEYSGRFLSGATVGPVRNGAPCRSPMPDDPLEAIQLRILERQAPHEEVKHPSPAKPAKPPAPSRFTASDRGDQGRARCRRSRREDSAVRFQPAHGETEDRRLRWH
jgi:hypothetical protein